MIRMERTQQLPPGLGFRRARGVERQRRARQELVPRRHPDERPVGRFLEPVGRAADVVCHRPESHLDRPPEGDGVGLEEPIGGQRVPGEGRADVFLGVVGHALVEMRGRLVQHAAVGGAKRVLAARAAQMGEGSLRGVGVVRHIDVLGARVRPARPVVAHGHAVVEAQEAARADGVEQQVVPSVGLAGELAPELDVEPQQRRRRFRRVSVPIDLHQDPGVLDARSRFDLDARGVLEGHGKRGRVSGVELRGEIARVERVGRQSVELAEEVAERRLDGGGFRAVPEHAQDDLALVRGCRPAHGGHEDAADAPRTFELRQRHRRVRRQGLARRHARGGETLGQREPRGVHRRHHGASAKLPLWLA